MNKSNEVVDVKDGNAIKLVSRLLFFILGMVILVIGVVLCSKVNYGMAPYDGFVLNASNGLQMKYGTVNTIIGCMFILMQFLILRKEFRVASLIQFVFLLLIGVLLDFFLYTVFAFDFPTEMIYRFPLFLIGMTSISLGIAMFMSANFYSFPLETLLGILYEKYRIKLAVSKWSLDASFLILSVLVCWIFELPSFNIGIGTLILFVCVGPLIGLFYERCKKILARVSV